MTRHDSDGDGGPMIVSYLRQIVHLAGDMRPSFNTSIENESLLEKMLDNYQDDVELQKEKKSENESSSPVIVIIEDSSDVKLH